MSEQIVINNLLVNYFVSNKDGKIPIIFLHGWRSEGKVWKSVIDNLNDENYATYALDLPGFGKSSAPENAYMVGDYVETIRLFMEKLGFKKIILVGHSFGGRIGIKFAAKHPELLIKLILVDSAGLKLPEENNRNNVKKILAKLVKPIFKLPIMQNTRKEIYRKMGAEDYVATPQIQQTYLNIINEDLRSYLPQIKVPTLLVWGENDIDTPLIYANIMNSEITNSKLKIIENAGHFSFLDNADQFSDRFNKFLKE